MNEEEKAVTPTPTQRCNVSVFSPDVDVPLILEKCNVIAGSYNVTPVSESRFVFESPVVEEEVEVAPADGYSSTWSSEAGSAAEVDNDATGGRLNVGRSNNSMTLRPDDHLDSNAARVRTKIVTVKRTVVKRVVVKRKVSKPQQPDPEEEEEEEKEDIEAENADMKGEKPGSVTRRVATSSSVRKPVAKPERRKEVAKPSVRITRAESAVRKPATVATSRSRAEKARSPTTTTTIDAKSAGQESSVARPTSAKKRSSIAKPEIVQDSSSSSSSSSTRKSSATKARTRIVVARPTSAKKMSSTAKPETTLECSSSTNSAAKPATTEASPTSLAKPTEENSPESTRIGLVAKAASIPVTKPVPLADDSIPVTKPVPPNPVTTPIESTNAETSVKKPIPGKDRKSSGRSATRKTSSRAETSEATRKSTSLPRNEAIQQPRASSCQAARKSSTLPAHRKRNSVPAIPTWAPPTSSLRRKSLATAERKRRSIERPRWNSSTRPNATRKKGFVVGVGATASPADVAVAVEGPVNGANGRKRSDDACAVDGTLEEAQEDEDEDEDEDERRSRLPETDLFTLRRQSNRLSDSDLQHMKESALHPQSSPFGNAKRRVMPKVRRRPSTNPVRQLINRKDVSSEVVVTTSNRRWTSLGFGSRSISPSNNLHESALAGLASREDFASVILRKTKKAADGTAIDEEKEDPSNYPSLVVVQIKGRRHIQVSLAEPSYSSLSSNDVFLVFTPTELYLFVGSDANVIEKAKGVDLAGRIVQKKDMGCKARAACVVEQKTGSTGLKMVGLKKVLGGTGNGEIKMKSDADVASDDAFEKCSIQSVMIYSVREDSERLDPLAELCGRQPKHSLLGTKLAFVFDFVNEVYVWIGRTTLGSLRRKATKLGKELFDSGYRTTQKSNGFVKNGTTKTAAGAAAAASGRRRPAWALFSRVVEGSETFLFKEKFPDWPEPGRIIKMKGHVSSGEVQPSSPPIELVPCSGESMHRAAPSVPNCILEGDNLARGRGVPATEEKSGLSVATTDVKIWHVKEHDYTEVPDWERGLFYSGEGYIVRWGYRVFKEPPKRRARAFRHRTVHDFGGREKCCYFFWQGDDCPITEKGASALLTVELDEEKGPQVRVPQGKEPPAFLQLFGGGLVVVNGKRPEINNEKETRIDRKVFCVRGEVPHEAYLVEIPKADSWALRSRGCLVSVATNTIMLWKGSKATEETNNVATAAAERLQKRLSSFELDLETFVEGEERVRFWRSLGGGRDYDTLKDEPAKYRFTPRLFELSRAPGPFSYDEISSPSRLPNGVCSFPFLQSDLYSASQPALFLVDAHYEVYLWTGWWKPQGDESNALPGNSRSRWLQDKELAMKTAVNYGEVRGRGCPVYVVAAGREPPEFKALFPYWEDVAEARELSAHDYSGPPRKLAVEEELDKLNRKYTLCELRRRPPPDGVDPLRLESYLSDKEFQVVFGMSAEKFAALAQWKAVNAKKAAGLF